MKYGNSATGPQHQVCVSGDEAPYGYGNGAWRARSWSTNVYVPKELQPRVRSSVVKLVGAVLSGKSVPTGVEFLSTCYLDFGMGSDTVSNESLGRPQSVVNVCPKLPSAYRGYRERRREAT